ncbi:MAG: DUF1501 domain-containing protein [Planctomycetota bacterium]
MLEILGQRRRTCDGVSRRGFLRAGFLGTGMLGAAGLTLADQLRADAWASAQGKPRSQKSVILIWEHGGPSQLETFDMKPDAPSEYRGPYEPIESTLPGLMVSEKMPYHAKIMDKTTVIRTLTHGNGDHWAAAHWLLTGYLGATGNDRPPRKPSMGSIISSLMGPTKPGAPAAINFNDGGFGYHGAAYLGVANNPIRIGEFSYGNEAGRLPSAEASSFQLMAELSQERLAGRLDLTRQLDRVHRDLDNRGTFDGMDRMTQQAIDILLSGRTRDALDLSKEDPKVREEYGPGWGEQALMARRLIEAGVRYVSLNTGYWDDHGNLKGALDDKLPRHDRAVGVLIEDLARRGLLDDTLVVTAGEFGRTPRINKDAGRDHWPQTQSVLLAGGGYRHGQIIGSTTDKAEYPTSRPITPSDFCAIIYHALGLSGDMTTLDLSGRPNKLLAGGEVPRELL